MVSVVHTQTTGVIVGALGFRNQYNGHTLEEALQQTTRLTGSAPKTATVDRGYKGRTTIGETAVQIPKPFSEKSTSRYKQQKLKQSFQRSAGIAPVISHLKWDHRLSRNVYRGIFGDNSKVMLSAAAFNFRRMMNKWKASFLALFFRILVNIQHLLLPKNQLTCATK